MSYPSRDSSVVVQEGSERLRIYSDGQVIYDPTEEGTGRYPIQGIGEDLTLWEAVGSAWSFVDGALSDLCGEARLYLMDVEATGEGRLTVRSAISWTGRRCSWDRTATPPRWRSSGGEISAYHLQLRSYAYLDEGPAIMPELQAAAALGALDGEGLELMICYPETAGGTQCRGLGRVLREGGFPWSGLSSRTSSSSCWPR